MKKVLLLLYLVTRLFSSDSDYEEENIDIQYYEGIDAYQCDGRAHCSQMSSCEEAVYFINNCPNTKMDGDHDGVPCERQWCE